MSLADDFSKGGTKLEGQWENDRNAVSRKLFTDIIREVFKTDQTIIAHHLVYSIQESDYFIVEEIPSADALIFDHSIMRKVFGDGFLPILQTLACEPCETRDAKLSDFYYSRGKVTQ